MGPLLLLVLGLIAAGIWLVAKWLEAQRALLRLEERVDRLEQRLTRESTPAPEAEPAPPPAAAFAPPGADEEAASPPNPPVVSPAHFDLPRVATPPPLPLPQSPVPALATQPEMTNRRSLLQAVAEHADPLATTETKAGGGPQGSETPVPNPSDANSAVSPWESFLGIKLFAWVGGLALFLGVAFFIKYSFEKDLISPAMRVALGYAAGLGLLSGAWWIPRERHVVTVQSLTATGVVVLYADTFAAQAHYGFLDLFSAFTLMSVITVVAFLLAVRLNAQVVAVLGWLGGFLTPWLLSTGRDNAFGLFGYLALLDLGLLAVVIRQRWNYLAFLAAAATTILQFGWVATHFTEAKINTAMIVFTGFAALFVGAFGFAHRLGRFDRWTLAAAILPAVSGWIFAEYLLWLPAIASQTALLLGYILVLDLVFVGLVWWRRELLPVLAMAGGGVFALLLHWTMRYLTPERLDRALIFYALFAAIHALGPLLLTLRRPAADTATPRLPGWVHLFPSLTLVLLLVPFFSMVSPSRWIWPLLMFVNLVAIGLAILTRSLGSILAMLLLTALATAAWIFQLPAELPGVTEMLIVVAGFSIFFTAAALFAGRKLELAGRGLTGGEPDPVRDNFSQMICLAALLPFLLLTLVLARLPLTNPSAVFGLASALAVMLLFLGFRHRVDLLAIVTLVAILVLEHVWFLNHFTPAQFALSLGWFSLHSALFFLFPFLMRTKLGGRNIPWMASALAWPLHFHLFHWALHSRWPDYPYPGLVPALLVIPCLLGFGWLLQREAATAAGALTRRALFGGVVLFFITLIPPIQFERHWITLSWALEGAALLWLFRVVPHPGLRLTGAALLIAAFVRLAANPWVLTDYERTGVPLWNWYLYTYALVGICLLTGARLLAPPRHRVLGLNLPPWLYTLGTILLFLLVNIEIADFFSPPGGRLVFDFSAGFAQDMAYTLAWALFASVLMAIGFRWRQAGTRYAGLGLLVFTLIKLFLHDLWRLGGLHRIGALIGLAIVLILVSFVYQRFLFPAPGATRRPSSQSGPADKDYKDSADTVR
jgi:uncharacterized membrane protein